MKTRLFASSVPAISTSALVDRFHRSIRHVPLALLGVALASAPLAAADTWDPTADFGLSNGNPNGPWTYGWMPLNLSGFTPYTNGATNSIGCPQWYGWGGDWTPCVWKNCTSTIRWGVGPGQLSLHPGDGRQASVVRWTVPAGVSGAVRIFGQFLPGDVGAVDVAVLDNFEIVWSGHNSGSFDVVRSVTPGQTINFAVYNGYGYGNTPLIAQIITNCLAIQAQPASGPVCIGSDADLSVSVSGGEAPNYQWQWREAGETDYRAVALGANLSLGGVTRFTVDAIGLPTQSVLGVSSGLAMQYRCTASNTCGSVTSDPATLSVNSADFNNDGDVGTDADIEAFFACLAGNCCGTCGSVDFNGDGDVATDADIEAFFRVLAGGNC